ncbi:ABC transporter permease [Pelagibacterium halotolerans]|uniref:Dipeptide transport system permease protein DppC n=1 Tax=Pelagibacterium halotolerans (strain DSM 22347 / JCM 15775 / CGMCC 1.7692 / B2) TaxID=1082931 RepID=G4REH1_PELHB|nr:ABC transporter permease [Pelagibacterium halotolerans]AEQ53903.1 dipeptide transport system permease protein DppC [Pelagibacterium halotolerans B2]QJR19954.1 ABC transporter permease [Pelagibacterium halotolerans]SEA46197.1 peptide/nickel transport system permease protein [Pelagibacterium halotolerans]
MNDITPTAPKSRFARIVDSDIFYSYRTSPVAIVSSIVATVLILAAIFAPFIAPYDPFNPRTLNLMNGFTPPMSESFSGSFFMLGSDHQGRDVFSAILYGSRVSLMVGLSAILFAMVLGVTLGLIAGYRGGLTDTIIMRVADVQLSFPSILIALLIFGIARGIIPPNQRESMAIFVLIFSIGLSDWAQFARTVRGTTMVERQKDYVSAARIIGVKPVFILIRHILPNVLGPVLVIGTIGLALAIIAEATLSFLGVGVPPTQPSLGTLIRIGQQFLFSGEWWILFFPAITLVLLALSVNLLGDWLRDALNPRLR